MIDSASALRSAALRRVLTSSGSSSALPIVWRGLSDPYGFWNTIWISRLRRFRVAALACATSSPSIRSAPAVGFSIKVRSRASVDLPDPDSPTTAKRAPRLQRERHVRKRLDRRVGAERAARDGIVARQAPGLEDGGHEAAPCSATALGNPETSGVRHRARPSAALRRRRRDVTAGVEDKGAARRERAAARPIELPGHDAGNGGQAPLGRPLRQRRQKRGGIGMMRIGEQVARGVRLHLLAGVLDDDPVGGFGDDAHVMGDEHEPHAVVAAQPHQKIEDLRLDGHVERGRRLVGDQELGPAGERHRDHDPLAHAARKLVGIGARPARRIGNADFGQKLDDAPAALGAIEVEVGLQRFADLKADGEARIERRHRLLEDHRHVLAGEPAPLIGASSTGDRRRRRPCGRRRRSRPEAGGPSPPASPPTCRSRIRRRSPALRCARA